MAAIIGDAQGGRQAINDRQKRISRPQVLAGRLTDGSQATARIGRGAADVSDHGRRWRHVPKDDLFCSLELEPSSTLIEPLELEAALVVRTHRSEPRIIGHGQIIADTPRSTHLHISSVALDTGPRSAPTRPRSPLPAPCQDTQPTAAASFGTGLPCVY